MKPQTIVLILGVVALTAASVFAGEKAKTEGEVKIEYAQFKSTGSLNQKRAVFADYAHNMLMPSLSDGRVIAISGKTENPRIFYRSCELYNPQTGASTPGLSLPEPKETAFPVLFCQMGGYC